MDIQAQKYIYIQEDQNTKRTVISKTIFFHTPTDILKVFEMTVLWVFWSFFLPPKKKNELEKNKLKSKKPPPQIFTNKNKYTQTYLRLSHYVFLC